MSKLKATPAVEAGEGDNILALLDARVRKIAEEVVRRNALAGDVGAVKVSTAARMLDMNQHRVRQLIKEGRLKAVNPTPNTVRIPLSEIRRFQEGQQ